MSLRGALIDFGYTLAYIDEEEDTNYRKEIVTLLRKHGYSGSLDEFSPALDDAYRNNRAGETKNMYEFWGSLLSNLDISERLQPIRELDNIRKRYAGKTIRLYDGVPLVLSDLNKRYRLALVSNCATGLSDIIDALGLDPFFESMILSFEVGAKKPDTRIYITALRTLKLKPEECIFVADEISDLEGARKVGLKTILVRQGPHTQHEIKDSTFKPDYECSKIIEVLKFI